MNTDEDGSNSEPYHTADEDVYVPDKEVSYSSECSDQEIPKNANYVTPRRTRKRRRCENEWKRNQKKKLRTEGKEYVRHRNNAVCPSRKLKEYNHRCRYKCNENITELDRQELFNNFYKLPSYDLQTSFLCSCIKKEDVARTKLSASKNRNFSTKIMLSNKRVCKAFFLNTFDITNRRFTTICNKTSRLGICETDKRGKASSVNKIDENTRNTVIKHINMFPRYKSHYSRKDNSETRYLSPDLSITKMHNLYKEFCTENNKTAVKLSYYRKIFNTEFNLKFHKPHTDTCTKCDSLQNLIKHSQNAEIVQSSKAKLELHQRKAEKAVQCKKSDIETHKSANDTAVICFDLQQTLPTPLLTASKVFYLRQLWTYNFGVHNLISGEADMFVWDETVSSRGSQEIGSCLLQYIKALPPNITKLIAYSDSCGGQNKNKNICKLFMFLVKATHITDIQHKFLEPGHTYMECDRDFALIERNKRKIPAVFIPTHWRQVINSSSRKFKVHEMTNENFYSFKKLNSLIKNPQKDNSGKSIKFREIVHFQYKKDAETFSFQFKPTLEHSFPFSKCVCSSSKPGRPSLSLNDTLFTPLNKNPVKIKFAKWSNLQTLLSFIPPIYHPFYTNMPHKNSSKNQKSKTRSKNNTEDSEVLCPNSDVDVDSDSDGVLYNIDSDYE